MSKLLRNRGKCRHCENDVVTLFPRGLCYRCYIVLDIRHEYCTNYNCGKRGLGLENTSDRPLPVPTEAIPGSEEKLKVLEERALLGLHLWHPCDSRGDLS